MEKLTFPLYKSMRVTLYFCCCVVCTCAVDVKMAKTASLKNVKKWETTLKRSLVYDTIENGRIKQLR